MQHNAAELGVLGSSQGILPRVARRKEDGTSGRSGQPITIFPIAEVPLPTESATTTSTHAVTVAAGVFAPGQLGELTQYLPSELVDDVLEQTGTVRRRLRDLPSGTGVYFLLALGLYPRLGHARAWDKLTAGLHGIAVRRPSEKALRDLRRRLGPAPMKALFEVIAGPLAQPRTPGLRFGGLRTVAFDGCNSLKVPDLAPRRLRYSARKVKCATSRYLNRDDGRPGASTAITAIDITIRTPPID